MKLIPLIDYVLSKENTESEYPITKLFLEDILLSKILGNI